MKTEKDRMLAGELYDPEDAQLADERQRARRLTREYNDSRSDETSRRGELIRQLIPDSGANITIEPPFFCDYGSNIRLGDNVYFNFNCVVLDVALVRIGSWVLFGPGVHVYAATHPLSAAERRSGRELGRPVEIGDDVWIGGGAIICPGVTIGAGAVIGAGSVVTGDIPAGMLAAGNPCRVIRPIGSVGCTT
jgi:maltose O-acetyltransferase